jgi:prophage antirepressor-like protein
MNALVNAIQFFNYQGKQIRTVLIEGIIWWVLKDVCGVLGVQNQKQIADRLELDEVGIFDIPHPQNPDKTLAVALVSESGLYNIILRSDKPEAKEFGRWLREMSAAKLSQKPQENAKNQEESALSLAPIRFENAEFGDMDILFVDGKAMFPAIETALKLGYANPRDAIFAHCKQKDGVAFYDVIDQVGRTQKKKYISEGNLYRLIVHSKLPGAERFEKWVFDDVLPQIRKTGSYSPTPRVPTTYKEAVAALLASLEEQERLDAKIAEQVLKIKEDEPKVNLANAITASKLSILVGHLAKILKRNGIDIGQNRLFAWLREHGYLSSRRGKDWNMPTQMAMDLGLFEIVEKTINCPDGSVKVVKTVYVTGKGQQYFVSKFLNEKKANEELEAIDMQ